MRFYSTFKEYDMAENDSSDMMEALASLSQTKASIEKAEARRKASMAKSKALLNAMMVQQKDNVMKGEIQKATKWTWTKANIASPNPSSPINSPTAPQPLCWFPRLDKVVQQQTLKKGKSLRENYDGAK